MLVLRKSSGSRRRPNTRRGMFPGVLNRLLNDSDLLSQVHIGHVKKGVPVRDFPFSVLLFVFVLIPSLSEDLRTDPLLLDDNLQIANAARSSVTIERYNRIGDDRPHHHERSVSIRSAGVVLGSIVLGHGDKCRPAFHRPKLTILSKH